MLGWMHDHGVGHLYALVDARVEVTMIRPLKSLRVQVFSRGPEEDGTELEEGLVDPRERFIAATVIQMRGAENVIGK